MKLKELISITNSDILVEDFNVYSEFGMDCVLYEGREIEAPEVLMDLDVVTVMPCVEKKGVVLYVAVNATSEVLEALNIPPYEG